VAEELAGTRRTRYPTHADGQVRLNPDTMRQWAPGDGIANFQDCQFWILAGDNFDTPIVPIRKYAVLVNELFHFEVKPLPAQPHSVYFVTLRQACAILASSKTVVDDVGRFFGISNDWIVEIPHYGIRTRSVDTSHPRGEFILWVSCDSDALLNGQRILRELK